MQSSATSSGNSDTGGQDGLGRRREHWAHNADLDNGVQGEADVTITYHSSSTPSGGMCSQTPSMSQTADSTALFLYRVLPYTHPSLGGSTSQLPSGRANGQHHPSAHVPSETEGMGDSIPLLCTAHDLQRVNCIVLEFSNYYFSTMADCG